MVCARWFGAGSHRSTARTSPAFARAPRGVYFARARVVFGGARRQPRPRELVLRERHIFGDAPDAPRVAHIAPRIVEATSRRRRGDARTNRSRASSITAPRRAP